jgi:hypothetical protein
MFIETTALANITCRVCGQSVRAPITASGLLCDVCRIDPAATERYVTQVRSATESRFQKAVESWGALYDLAGETDQRRYHNVGEARAKGASGFAAKYDQALARDDGLGMLLRSKERCDAVADEWQRVRRWAKTALAEVEAARDATH